LNAGRRVSRRGHERLTSGFAFGPRLKTEVSRDLLNLAFAGREQRLNALLARTTLRPAGMSVLDRGEPDVSCIP
jgi:hypothetical protein